MRFYTNLREQSWEFYQTATILPDAWLLSSHRSTENLSQISSTLEGSTVPLLADNGTIEFIRETNAEFADRAKALELAIRTFRRALPEGRRIPYSTEVPLELAQNANKLADDVLSFVDRKFASVRDEEQLDIQLAMRPTSIICKEDWAIASILGFGLEREILGWNTGRFVTRNRKSLRAWDRIREKPNTKDSDLFVTLAASDYTTARAAAREASEWGVENIALGFAGLNSTHGYTDVTYYPVRQKLAQPGPRRYARLAEIVLGIRDGYRDGSTTLQTFHALGLGSRIMWYILAAGFDWWTDISVDATSAIQDISGRSPVLYVPGEPAKRMSVGDVTDHLVENQALPFESPHLEAGVKAHPMDLKIALATKRELGLEKITHESLRSENPMGKVLPLFANGAGTTAAAQHLIHHNYWASEMTCAGIPKTRRRIDALRVLERTASRTGTSPTVRNGCGAAFEILGAA